MARRYRFRQVDVFTDRPFAGNPLAVFPDAVGLDDAAMQAIAREMNLSETTFVLPPSAAGRAARATYRMRIFTPALELPFAGHPSVGTAWVLADEGRIPLAPAGATIVRQEIGIGVLPLEIGVVEGRPATVTMTQGQPHLLDPVPSEGFDALAGALGVAVAELGWTDPDGTVRDAAAAPPRMVTTGLPYLIIPFRDRSVVASIPYGRIAAAAAAAAPYGSDSAVIIASGTCGAIPGADAHMRVLVDPATGIGEDPATGSAAGPAALYLGVLAGARAPRTIVIEQGVEVGRPSRIVTAVDFAPDGRATTVRVSGEVVPIFEAWLELAP